MDVLEEGHKVLATTISASGHYPSAVKVLGNNSGATALPDPDVEGSPSYVQHLIATSLMTIRRIAKSD